MLADKKIKKAELKSLSTSGSGTLLAAFSDAVRSNQEGDIHEAIDIDESHISASTRNQNWIKDINKTALSNLAKYPTDQVLESAAKKITKKDGYIIVMIPLYFDIVDRFKILFTGSVISMDNLCYGKEYYSKFRSYNYDHIRFFRPSDIFEMGESLGLKVDKVEYNVTGYGGNNFIFKVLTKLIANKYTVNLNPNLFAHRMKIRWKVD